MGFFQEHDTFIRRPMLIHLCKTIYNNLKDNDKIKFLEDINNIKLNVYDNCEINFTRISDKKFNETETLKSQKETFSHILEAFLINLILTHKQKFRILMSIDTF